MQKRLLGAASLVGVAALLMSACGGSTPTPAATGDAAATTTPAATSTTTGAPVRDASVDLVIWSDADRATILKKYADQFGQEQGIKVADPGLDRRPQGLQGRHRSRQGTGRHRRCARLARRAGPEQRRQAGQPVHRPSRRCSCRRRSRRRSSTASCTASPTPSRTSASCATRPWLPNAPATFEDMIAKGKALKDAGKATNAFLQQVGKIGDAYYSYPYLSAFGGGIFAMKPNGDYDPTKVLVDSPGSVKGATLHGPARQGQGPLDEHRSTPRQALFDDRQGALLRDRPVGGRQGQGGRHQVRHLPAAHDRGQARCSRSSACRCSTSRQGQERRLRAGVRHELRPEEGLQLDLFEAGQRPPALKAAYDEVAATDPDVKAWYEAGAGGSADAEHPRDELGLGPAGPGDG